MIAASRSFPLPKVGPAVAELHRGNMLKNIASFYFAAGLSAWTLSMLAHEEPEFKAAATLVFAFFMLLMLVPTAVLWIRGMCRAKQHTIASKPMISAVSGSVCGVVCAGLLMAVDRFVPATWGNGPTCVVLAITLSLLPIGYSEIILRLASIRRPGYCNKCGYDLRASKEKCPECGSPIPPSARHPAPNP